MQRLASSGNLIINGDFAAGRLGGVPEGWRRCSPRPALAPVFKLVNRAGRRVLLAAGNGRDDCVGCLAARVLLRAGRTYRFGARFEISRGLNPQKHLLFCVFAEKPDKNGRFNSGIFNFRRLGAHLAEGEGSFQAPADGDRDGEVRLYFRQSARQKAWIHSILLEEREAIPPRLVTVACMTGNLGLVGLRKFLEAAGKGGADLVLLPEMMNGQKHESLRGPSARLMAAQAARFGTWVAGGILLRDAGAGCVYNAALLYDRRGKLAGRYLKNHLFTPEVLESGLTCGTEVPVFHTDFGAIGIMICYDSWFTDVAELLALKGAEVILFPNAGYYRGLMPARAADNGVRIVASSLGHPCGIWDTTGREVTARYAEKTCFANHPPTFQKVLQRCVAAGRLLMATLDLSRSPSPHNWGGPLLSAPGGRRNRREQSRPLWAEIQRQAERWWDE